MFDDFMGMASVPIASGSTRTQSTAGGTAVVDQGNSSARAVSPAGATRGLTFDSADLFDEQILSGRVTLGLLEAGLIVLILGYVWTRRVQGGG